MRINYTKKKILFYALLLMVVLLFVGVHYSLAVEALPESGKETLAYGALGVVGTLVAFIVGIIAYIFTALFGLLITLMVAVLVQFAQFNNIISVPVVMQGWVVVRDLCNMFFVLILLVIAFATILRRESYSAKSLLPKLIIMAVLINFSKTIFGLIIDFGQVAMLTFVSAFKDGGGWFIDMFQVKLFTSLDYDTGGKAAISSWGTAAAIIAGLMASIITLVVLCVMVGVLVVRIVMLWIYTILSPLVFLGMAFPPIQQYTGKIFQDFIKQVATGPLLAFFIWLALYTASDKTTALIGTDTMCAGLSGLFCVAPLQKFILVIGLLVGGLMVTQQMGGAAAGIAGMGMAALKKGRGLAWSGTKIGADWVNRKQAKKLTGMDLNPFRFADTVKTYFNNKKQEDIGAIDEKANKNLAHGGIRGLVTGFSSHDWLDNYWGANGVRQVTKGGKTKRDSLLEEGAELKKKANTIISPEDLAKKQKRLDDLQFRPEHDIKNSMEEYVEGYHKSKGEIAEQRKLEREISAAHVFKGTPEQVAEEKAKLQSDAKSLYSQADAIKIKTTYGKQNLRNSIAAQEKNVVSENEDELSAEFASALRENNIFLAAAIAKKTTKAGGMNTLLENMGYNVKAGLTEEEAKGMDENTYKKERGFNDFMRDIFGGELGMDKQSYLALQNDISGLGESNSHAYLRKTVTVKDGNLVQSDSKSRKIHRMVEDSKGDVEGFLRKNNRLEYGSEDINDHYFDWSDDGLALFVSRIASVDKEINGNRLNKNAAAKITMSDRAIEKLTNVLMSSTMQNKLPAGFDVESFIKKFVQYGRNASLSNDEDAIEEVLEAAKGGM